ncbi:PKD domain-containing protein [Zobellia sp. B3R18]|uniref:PKD domain-containing protein n=1 Tax=Zobellia sp. B3R18 TaxID=2841568 RepID=UPI001C077429|nr:PKD domain-containing protein [Zobellia sp. B3R18]MBU2975929.1 PKD domain-containing protein [Zobellia sp. B3R18]
MKFYPTTPSKSFIGFVFIFLLIIISCSKDSELLKDAVLADPSTAIKEDTKETSEEITEEELVPEEAVLPEEEEIVEEKVYETRTTVFTTIHDAHLQSGKGYNQDLIRLDEGHRESYLMFDISPIDSIGGIIEEAHLEFTISTDDGHGTISVLKGDSTDWSEHDISEITAPKSDTLLGSTTDDYHVNQTQEIILDQEKLNPEVLTLVLKHEDGNDLAFASKEHSSKNGPKLVITYSAPQDSEGIVSADQNPTKEVPSSPSIDDEDAPVSETPEEPTNQEEEEEEAPSNDTPEVIEEEEPDTPISTENQSPIAVVDASPSSGTAPLKVNFTGNNSSDDEEVKNYGWNFGDGSSSNEANPSHTFEKAGTFKVVLTVQDAQGKIDTEETTITVKAKENNAPAAVAKASVTSGEAPLKVTFDGKESSDDIGVTSYLWDFKDGDKGSLSSTSHTFTKAGTYVVVLTVKDKDGLEDTDTVTITVTEKENEAPTAKASANTTEGEAPLEIQFKGSNSTDDTAVKSYFWDFKDGSTSTSSNPSHSFTKKGTYNVILTVTDEEGLKDSDTITITITETENEAPVAVASGSPLTGYAPLTVELKAYNSTDDKAIKGYFWDFKDGSTTTTKNPSHTFSEAGIYQVELSVKDEEGLTHSTTIEVKVNERPVDNSGGNTGGGDTGSGGNTGGGSSGGGSSSGGSSSGGSSGNYPSNAVFASDYGFKSGDATAAFEAAITSGNSYIVIDKQSSDWVIQPMKFFNLRDITIVFEEGVVLRAKKGAFGASNAQLFQMANPSNVTIEGNGAIFQMNKSEYTNGEGRHGISIYGGKDISISNLTIKDSGGDGIFITRSSNKTFSENINLTGLISQNNRRQGLTITSGHNVNVKNSSFSSSSGRKPEAGVDLEPDEDFERLTNINFSNCIFSGNDSFGFLLSTIKLNSSSLPISITVKDSEFKNNGKSPESGVSTTEIYIGGGQKSNPVKGEIRFERIKFNGSRSRIIFSRKSANGYKAIFKDCEARNVVSSNSDSPIELQAESTNNTLGNFVFDNFYIEYSKNVPFMEINAPSAGGSFTVKNISGSFILKEPNNHPLLYSGGYNPAKNSNVSINWNH